MTLGHVVSWWWRGSTATQVAGRDSAIKLWKGTDLLRTTKLDGAAMIESGFCELWGGVGGWGVWGNAWEGDASTFSAGDDESPCHGVMCCRCNRVRNLCACNDVDVEINKVDVDRNHDIGICSAQDRNNQ